MTVKMEKHTARKYSSPIRERQANQTRTNILDATQRLFLERGYAKTTVEAIAQEAGVAKQTVYAVFRSKNGIVAELLDRAVFTERVFELHDRSLETANIHEALKLTAQLVLQVHESQSPVFDLLRGAGMLDPQLARVQNDLRCVNRDRQENHVRFLLRGRRLKEGIDMGMALDVFWCLTSRDLYRMLVQERGWSGETYANWLYEMLANSLLHVSEEHPGEGGNADGRTSIRAAVGKRRPDNESGASIGCPRLPKGWEMRPQAEGKGSLPFRVRIGARYCFRQTETHPPYSLNAARPSGIFYFPDAAAKRGTGNGCIPRRYPKKSGSVLLVHGNPADHPLIVRTTVAENGRVGMAGLDAGNDHFELFHLPDLFLFVPALFQCVDNGLGLFPVKDLFRDVARVLQQFVGHAKVFGDVRVVFQLQRLARSGKGIKSSPLAGFPNALLCDNAYGVHRNPLKHRLFR